MDVYVPVGKWNGVSIAGKVIPPASQPASLGSHHCQATHTITNRLANGKQNENRSLRSTLFCTCAQLEKKSLQLSPPSFIQLTSNVFTNKQCQLASSSSSSPLASPSSCSSLSSYTCSSSASTSLWSWSSWRYGDDNDFWTNKWPNAGAEVYFPSKAAYGEVEPPNCWMPSEPSHPKEYERTSEHYHHTSLTYYHHPSIHPSNRPSVRPFKCLSIESLRWCAECWRVDFVRYGNRVLSLAMGTLHCVVFEALQSECNGGKKTQSANIVQSWNWPNNCRRVMTVATDNRVSHMNK